MEKKPVRQQVNSNDEIWVNKFTEEAAQQFREDLFDAAKVDPSRPIIIYIDSYGGYVDSLAKMIEAMDEVRNPLITVCHGKAMSCGAILLSHGDIRLCGPHSRIMVHEVSAGTGGNVNEMINDTKEVARLNDYFMTLMAKNCGMKSYAALREHIKKNNATDIFLNADQAVKFGITDAIGSPKVDAEVQYRVSIQKPKSETAPKTSKTTSKKVRSKKTKKTNKK